MSPKISHKILSLRDATFIGGVFVLSMMVAMPSGFAQGKPEQNAPTQVIVDVVEMRDISNTIEALGNLRANEEVTLTPSVSKTITALSFEDGERVKKGTVLVEMTSGEEEALLREAESTLEEATKQLERARPLAENGTVSRSVLDQRVRDQETAQARLEALHSRLEDLLIRAPFDGRVGLRNVSLGAFIKPGDVVTTLVDDSRMKLDFSVPSVYLSEISTGLAVEARSAAYGDQRFSGVIESIDNRVDPITRSFNVRAVLPNKDGHLKTGLLMQVNIKTRPRNALVIPEEALIQESKKTFVFVSKPNENGEGLSVEKRLVRIGTRQVGSVEIVEGLKAGDTIVTHGTMKVRDGGAITIMSTQSGGASIPEILKGKADGEAASQSGEGAGQ